VELFFNDKFGGLGLPSVDRAVRLESMVDRGGADKRARWHLDSARRTGARSHQCSPVAVEEGEPDEAVSEGCSLEHERWRRGSAMAKKTGSGLSSQQERRKAQGCSGARGKRGGEGRRYSGVYIRGQGSTGEG
jgi:hypothetical protein